MLDKSGDVLSKVGDEVEYTIKLSNTSSAGGAAGAPSLVCDVSDAKIGFSETVTLAPGGSTEWKPTFTIPSGAADPYPNTASASCHYPGLSDVVASSQDDHSINLFQPSLKVEKSASNAYSKAGDKVTYTVKITNESSDDAPPLELASFTDSLVNGVTPDSSCDELGYGEDCSFTYDYTVQDGDDDPLPNTATALYHPEGFPNDITDSGSASVDLLHPSYTINKVCTSSQPVSQNAGSASFQVRINNTGDADLVITADDGIGTINLAAGGHYSKSVSVAGPFAGQASVSNTVSTTSVTLHEQYNLSNILDNQSSTASCQVGGLAKVKKTVSGAAPSGTQAFTFTLREGASVTSQGTTLQTLIANAGNGGNLAFSTNLVPGNHYQLCEDVMPGWNTTLGPNLFVPESLIPPALPNPNVNNMTVCTDFVAAAGGTEEKVVDNSPPPGGRALTIGFWKNWASCASSNGKGQKPMLDLALGLASKNTTNPPGGLVVSAQNPGSLWPNYAATWFMVLKGNPASTEQNILPAADCAKAVNLLNKSTADGRKKMASDPLFNMTAQLVAAQLNRFMGAGISGITIMNIDKAVLLNGKYKFDGLTYTPKLTAADTTLANCLATQLDNYNNNRPVSAC
jgi:uncharacterized repeat protein (TIGR01451 family)